MTQPPRHPGLPVLGNLLEAKDAAQEFYAHLMHTYGDIVEFKYLNRRFYFINNLEYVQRMLTESIFVRSDLVRKLMNSFTGPSLFVLEKDTHVKHRRLMQPMFHQRQIRAYAQTMISYTHEMLDQWQSSSQMDLAVELNKLVLRVVVTCLFNADGTVFAEELRQALVACQKRLDLEYPIYAILPRSFPMLRFGTAKTSFDTLARITKDLIAERRTSGQQHDDLLALLIAARDTDGQGLSDEDIHAEVLALLFAGHETTANTLTWIWYLLGTHPDVLQKLQDEVDSVLGSDLIRPEHLPRLPYTRMVIDETLRLYPPAWYTERVATEDTTFGEYRISPETTLVLSVYATHRDPRYFPDPLRFNPERFRAENVGKIAKYSYLPFGGGSHLCIGNNFALMEMQMILAMMVQSYSITLAEDFVLKARALVTLSIEGGLPVKLERRMP